MREHENQEPLVNVLHDTEWHALMPCPVFYGQFHEDGVTIHGGNAPFVRFLGSRKRHISYPCDGIALFRPAWEKEAAGRHISVEGKAEEPGDFERLFQDDPGWSRGSWELFGGDEVADYALFQDRHGWFVFFLEPRTGAKILEKEQALREELKDLAQMYSVGEMLDPLTDILLKNLGVDWLGILSWNSGEERWGLLASNGGGNPEEPTSRAMEIFRAFHAKEPESGIRFGGLDIEEDGRWWVRSPLESGAWQEVFLSQKVTSFFAGVLLLGTQPMILVAFSCRRDAFHRVGREVLSGLWPVLSSMVERYRLISGMAVLSQRDRVTGLAQGSTFLEKVDVELSRNRRYHYPMSLLYLDVRNREELLERGGERALDDGYRLVAREAVQSLRTVDIIGRLEEKGLLVLLPHTAFEGAHVVVRRMKERYLQISPLPDTPMKVDICSVSYSEGLIPDTAKVLEDLQKFPPALS